MDNNKIEFSDRLRELVNIKAVTQRDFAEAVNISASTMSAYLKGQKKPSLDTLINIANVYDISIDWLCGLADEQQSSRKVKTYSDVIKRLFEIEQAGIEDLSVFFYGEHQPIFDGMQCGEATPKSGGVKTDDTFLCEFFKNWEDMKKLHDEKTIDDNLYQLWIKQQLEKYNFSLFSKDEQIFGKV